jgi:hypothetical protein
MNQGFNAQSSLYSQYGQGLSAHNPLSQSLYSEEALKQATIRHALQSIQSVCWCQDRVRTDIVLKLVRCALSYLDDGAEAKADDFGGDFEGSG